jgi:arylformamidase
VGAVASPALGIDGRMTSLRRIDVSHPIEAGMKTYPGLPVPEAEVILDYEASRARYQNQCEFFIASLHLCGNTGTYVDAPRHRYRNGADLAALSLDRLAHVPVVVVDATGASERGVGPERLEGLDLAGKALLVHTGWARYFRTDRYFEPNPFLTAGACELLLGSGVTLVGIDSLNIDDIQDLSRPAHTLLLGAGIPICEHLTNLGQIPASGGFLHAVPIPWVGGATFPVRAYVIASP